MTSVTSASEREHIGAGPGGIRSAVHSVSGVVGLLAVIGFAGLVGGIPELGSLGRDFPPITPSSVLVLALFGVGLWALGLPGGKGARRLVRFTALSSFLVAAAVLALQLDLPGVGQERFLRLARPFHPFPTSMWTEAGFLLLSTAMGLATCKAKRPRALSQFLALMVAGMALVALVGLTIRIIRVDLSVPSVGMPLPVALALLVASFSVLVMQPRSRLLQLLEYDSPEAGIVRRLVPLAIGVPLLAAWVQALGERQGWFQTIESEGILTALMIIASMGLILWTSVKIDEMNLSRSLAERRAETDRQWLDATLANIGDAVITVNDRVRISFLNPAAEDLLEVRRTKAVGRDVDELLSLVDERTRDAIECPLREAFARAAPVSLDGEPALLREDGGMHAVDVTATPIRDAGGEVAGGVLVLRDARIVRARAHAERRAFANLDRRVADRTRALDRTMSVLRESTTLLRAIAATTPELIVAKSRDGRIMMINPAALQALGMSRAQVIGRREEEFLGDSEAVRSIVDNDRRVIDSGKPIVVEETRTVHEGVRTFLVTKSPLRDAQGQVFGLVGVAKDITERKRVEQELAQLLIAEHRLRDEAERASRAKDEFLAIVSHELRSPLNALKGWSQVLSGARAPEPELIGRAAEAIKRNIDHQTRLIDDLLDSSRVISGKLDLNKQRLNLVDVVQPTMEVLREQAKAKQIGLRFAPLQPVAMVDGDADRLQQVLSNLLSNAIKFTPEGGEVEVGVRQSARWVELSVTDTGIGIGADFLPHVFDRFSQADTSMTRPYMGLGIGLALVRNLVELHGGTVHATSAGVGQGATFTVCLPAVCVVDGGQVPTPAEGCGVGAAALEGAEVLLVDDDPDAREVMRIMLAGAGAAVTTFGSGEALLDTLEAAPSIEPRTILLLDIAMPGASGFEVLQRVREIDPLPFIPAIAVTALTHFDRSRFLSAGFQDSVGKPVDEATLVETIANVLELDSIPLVRA